MSTGLASYPCQALHLRLESQQRVVAFLEAAAELSRLSLERLHGFDPRSDAGEQFLAGADPTAELVELGRFRPAPCSRRGGGGADARGRSPSGSGNQHHGVVPRVFPVIRRTPLISRPPIGRLVPRPVASLPLASVEDHVYARIVEELAANPREEVRAVRGHDHEELGSHRKDGTSWRHEDPPSGYGVFAMLFNRFHSGPDAHEKVSFSRTRE